MGPTELLVIMAVGLMLFSPKELPKVLRSVARFWGSVRRTADEFRDAIMEDQDLREPLEEVKRAYRGTKAELREAEEEARRAVAKARMEMRKAERQLAQVSRETEATMTERVAAKIPASPTESTQEDAAQGPKGPEGSRVTRGPLGAGDSGAGRGAA